MKIIGTHLDTVDTRDLMDYLLSYCRKEDVEGFVIGRPLNLKNELNDIYVDIVSFKDKLTIHFAEKYIVEMDERFTSKLATQSILQSGVRKKKRQDKRMVDMVSAVIILQNYLELKSNLK
jgi:putative Holliday junction resolvase